MIDNTLQENSSSTMSTTTPPSTPITADMDDGQERHSSTTGKKSVNGSSQAHHNEEHDNDLTMGDIAMLSTTAPSSSSYKSTSIPSGRPRRALSPGNRGSTSYPRGAPSTSSSSSSFPSLRRDIDMPRASRSSRSSNTVNPVSSSKNTAPSSSIPGASMSSTSRSSGAAQDAYTAASSLPSTSPTNTSNMPSNSIRHPLLTRTSRNTLPPLPSLDVNAAILPPLPPIPGYTPGPASTSPTTSSMSMRGPYIPPTPIITSLPAVTTPVSHPPPPPPSTASTSSTAMPSKPEAITKGPYPDTRLNRFVETQADYKPGGYARISEGDLLNHRRYEIVKKLGVGHFSVVWLAWDRVDTGYVAIKVVRSSRRYSRAALSEIRMLNIVQEPQDERKQYVVTFLDSFEEPAWEGPDDHVCIFFEIMGMSLTDVLRKNDFQGLPIKTTKLIAKQALTALSYLHSLGIAHTDIKPDNILLYHSSGTMHKMLRAQLRADDLERERQEAEEALNPKPAPINWMEYKPKIPGLNPQQIKEIQLARVRAEARKWIVTPSMPIDSPIEFAKGRKVLSRKRLHNQNLLTHGSSLGIATSSTASGSQSGKTSFEIDRTSAAHPGSAEEGSKVDDGADKKMEFPSTQTTPTKDGNTTAVSSHPSSSSPKGKGTDTANTTDSSMTAYSSRQSSKSPYSSLGRNINGGFESAAANARPNDTSPASPYTAIAKTFDRMTISDFLWGQQQSNDAEVKGGLFGSSSRHPRTSSNQSSDGQSGGETEFEKLRRQPMEYDVPGLSINTGGPSPVFVRKSPSDSDGSEIFSPASTTISRFFHTNTSGASSTTDSPASLASTPIGSSPEFHLARKMQSPIFPHPGAVYSAAISIPRQQVLSRNGSNASIFGSSSYNSFSPAECGSVMQEQDHKARGLHPAVSRARSDYGFEDGQAFMSLPASPPSHPTSYISVASMSPEVAMRKRSGAGLGMSGLSRSESDASVNIGGTFDFAIQEEDEPESSTAEFGRREAEEAHATLTTGRSRGLPTTSSNVHGLGLSMSNPYAHAQALAIPKIHGRSSEALSASPPNSMSSSMHSSIHFLLQSATPSNLHNQSLVQKA